MKRIRASLRAAEEVLALDPIARRVQRETS
jgi:hypothetical protein